MMTYLDIWDLFLVSSKTKHIYLYKIWDFSKNGPPNDPQIVYIFWIVYNFNKLIFFLKPKMNKKRYIC